MNKDDLERLTNAVRLFRYAIEASDKRRFPASLKQFPRGSCGDAVLLHGTYLMQNDFGEFSYVSGERGDCRNNTWISHAWLEKGNLVVDITTDQFSEIADEVIICLDSAWHKPFKKKIENKADYRIYDINTVASLNKAYEEIMRHIKITL